MHIADTLSAYHSYLFSVAYHILGEVQEAEDIVQDSFEHFLSLPASHVQNVKSYLTRVVANKSIDRLKERKKAQEHYPGTWLPEPYVTTTEASVELPADMLSYGMMYLLEELNPLERAVFILREAFNYSYEALAELCEIQQDYCRQLLSRARKKMNLTEESLTSKPPATQPLLEAFLKAREEGDIKALTQLLKEDIILYSDGGGKKAAALVPLYGWETVTKFLAGVAQKPDSLQMEPQWVKINGQAGILLSLYGKPDSLITLEGGNQKISRLFFVRNPDKIFLH
uniref:Sigma-70 family RNA polymerase sigma factor n=1 Tax=Roseihalotalea indica TaxID=2867963 RepID=A0AA49JKB9_9BACT|nr:sigma-70 family RNA polymerase sigma factor [Tunicatimonas sp. TK19036]